LFLVFQEALWSVPNPRKLNPLFVKQGHHLNAIWQTETASQEKGAEGVEWSNSATHPQVDLLVHAGV